jgi:hypothetical protein
VQRFRFLVERMEKKPFEWGAVRMVSDFKEKIEAEEQKSQGKRA